MELFYELVFEPIITNTFYPELAVAILDYMDYLLGIKK